MTRREDVVNEVIDWLEGRALPPQEPVTSELVDLLNEAYFGTLGGKQDRAFLLDAARSLSLQEAEIARVEKHRNDLMDTIVEAHKFIRRLECECDPAYSTRACGRCDFLARLVKGS